MKTTKKLDRTWGAFIRTIGRKETVHNLFATVQAGSERSAWNKLRVPAGIEDDDHEIIVRQFTKQEASELEKENEMAIKIDSKVTHRRANNGVGIVKKLITDYDGGFTHGKHPHGAWVSWEGSTWAVEAPIGELLLVQPQLEDEDEISAIRRAFENRMEKESRWVPRSVQQAFKNEDEDVMYFAELILSAAAECEGNNFLGYKVERDS